MDVGRLPENMPGMASNLVLEDRDGSEGQDHHNGDQIIQCSVERSARRQAAANQPLRGRLKRKLENGDSYGRATDAEHHIGVGTFVDRVRQQMHEAHQ